MKIRPEDITKLIDEYDQELIRTLGNEKAEEYSINYRNGWFVVRHQACPFLTIRRNDFIKMITRLKERPTKEST